MNHCRFPTRLPLVALVAVSALTALPLARSARKSATPDAAPVLVSTAGGTEQWKNIAALEQAAEGGNPRACYDLALLALEGSPEVKKNPARAVALYEKAGEGGIDDAWFRLGKMHHDGVGVSRDLKKSFHYYLRAARAGVPEAQYNIGAMLLSARGVKRDYVEGLAWLIVAGKSGTPGDTERQVRERLKRRPADIAAAEARAAVLLSDPFERAGSAPAASVKVAPTTPTAPVVAPVLPAAAPTIEPPKIQITAPTIGLPTTPILPKS